MRELRARRPAVRHSGIALVVLMAFALGPAAARAGSFIHATLSVGVMGTSISLIGNATLVGGSTPLCGQCGTTSGLAPGAFLYAGSGFATTRTFPGPNSATTSKLTVRIGHNGALYATSGGVRVTAPLSVTLQIHGLGSLPLLSIPLRLGQAGTATANTLAGGHVSAIRSAWQEGQVKVTGTFTSNGVTLPTHTVATTGSFNLDATSGSGTVKLVSASHVISTGNGLLAPSNTVSTNSLTLLFIAEPGSPVNPLPPVFAAMEPGTLLLLGAAGAGLAGFRRRRRSR